MTTIQSRMTVVLKSPTQPCQCWRLATESKSVNTQRWAGIVDQPPLESSMSVSHQSGTSPGIVEVASAAQKPLLSKAGSLASAGIAALAIGLSLPGLAVADYTLTVLHTNDFHSRFEPISRFNSGCKPEDNTEGKCFGGAARMVSAVAAARSRTNNAILVDGGDQFQGSLFYTYYKGKAAAEMMNTLEYDAMTVGNHEFDDGPEVLRTFTEAVNFPILMSNGDVSKEPLLADKIRKSVVIERGGEKLGLIGLTPQDTGDLASPGKNITFTNPVDAVAAEVEKLEAEGINKIIVLSHSGYGVDMEVAKNVEGVDVIVGGHSNTLLSNTDEDAAGPYPTMVGNTAVVQAYAYGKYLGELNLSFDDDGNITEAKGDPLLISGEVVEEEKMLARVQELAEPLDEIRNKVVAETADDIEGNRDVCRVEECAMGNLIADAMLGQVKAQGISVALMNSGGIRASMESGEITMGDVLTVLPFQNTLSTFQLKGSDLIGALENGVSQVEEVKGRFPQVAGVKFTWDSTVDANGGRIVEVLVDDNGEWKPLDPEAMYGVVSNDFLRSGGDGYEIFANKAELAYDFGPSLDHVLAEYLAENAPYKPVVEGRITRK